MNVAPTRSFHVEGVAFWSPTLPGWPVARLVLRGEGEPCEARALRPSPEILAPAERRRVPDSVALALEVAAEAVRMSGREPASLPQVFTSAHGDLAVNDYMCRTLAGEPTLISPTRFHNSVHNAAAGYWTIGTGCRQASTALSAFDHSFAAGLLEAATVCAADERAVLLVACDVEATGALASVTKSEGLFACALVIAPQAGANSVCAFDWSVAKAAQAPTVLRSTVARALAGNGMADALPFFEKLAAQPIVGDRDGTSVDPETLSPLHLPLSRSLALVATPRAPARRSAASSR